MRQLKYTNSDFRFEYYMVKFYRCLISNHYDSFPPRNSHIPICVTCATSGRWQRHLCKKSQCYEIYYYRYLKSFHSSL